MSEEQKELDKVVTVDINDEMKQCYIDYAIVNSKPAQKHADNK